MGGQPVALYVGALISHLVGWESTHLSVCHPRPGSAAGGSGELWVVLSPFGVLGCGFIIAFLCAVGAFDDGVVG